MATHSSTLAWRIPGTEEASGLLSMGSHRVGHDWSDLAAAAAEKKSLGKKTKRYQGFQARDKRSLPVLATSPPTVYLKIWGETFWS